MAYINTMQYEADVGVGINYLMTPESNFIQENA